MTDAALLETVAMLNPRTLDRAKRVCEAARMLREGVSETEVRAVIRLRFKIGRKAAWIEAGMAADMVVKR